MLRQICISMLLAVENGCYVFLFDCLEKQQRKIRFPPPSKRNAVISLVSELVTSNLVSTFLLSHCFTLFPLVLLSFMSFKSLFFNSFS